MGLLIQFSPGFCFIKRFELGTPNPIVTVRDGKALGLLAFSRGSSDANRRRRPPQRSPPGRNASRGENKKPPTGSSGPANSNQEELISLFKRIKSSMSKEESNTKHMPAIEQPADNESLSGKRTGDAGLEKRRGRGSNWRDLLKESHTQLQIPSSDFKLARPSSKFVKKSPIPSSLSRTKVRKLTQEESADSSTANETTDLESLKVTELKELAKKRGIAGYSRLKKRDLIALLQIS